MKSQDNLMRYILLCLDIPGFSPMKDNFFSILRGFWTAFTYLILMIWLSLELFLNFQGLSTITRAIGLLPVLLTLAIKMYHMIILKKNKKSMILKTHNNLIHYFPKSVLDIGDANMNQVYTVFKLHFLVVFITCIQMLTQAILTRKPIVLTYKEQEMSAKYWCLIYFLDFNVLICGTLLYNGYNWLFLFFTAHVVSELKMLNAAISELDYEVTSEDFRIIVNHHKNILSIVKELNQIYSITLLMEYILNFLSIIFCLFCMTMDGIPPNGEHVSSYGLLSIIFMASMLLYSYAGDCITTQCDRVATSMFYAILKKPLDRKAKFASFMVIGRSHKQTAVSIGGFCDLNMETFYLALSKSVSFLMFIQALRERGHNPEDQRSLSI